MHLKLIKIISVVLFSCYFFGEYFNRILNIKNILNFILLTSISVNEEKKSVISYVEGQIAEFGF